VPAHWGVGPGNEGLSIGDHSSEMVFHPLLDGTCTSRWPKWTMKGSAFLMTNSTGPEFVLGAKTESLGEIVTPLTFVPEGISDITTSKTRAQAPKPMATE
jgi:hypothetical protein